MPHIPKITLSFTPDELRALYLCLVGADNMAHWREEQDEAWLDDAGRAAASKIARRYHQLP